LLAADRVLGVSEPQFVACASAPRFPPIFIIGLPRVGSTLVYQAIVRGLVTSYFCNAAATGPRAPALITRALSRFLTITPPDCYTSDYGITRGWNAPAQAREIWGRWFPGDQSYVGGGGCPASDLRAVRGTVSRVEQALGAPFVSKSQGHAVRILPLFEAFPGAVFVRVRRAAIAVAESILLGRRECFQDDTHWFSAKPSNHRDLVDLDPFQQIAAQIRSVDADMDRDLKQTRSRRIFEIEYADFCASPRATLAKLAEFYASSTGHSLRNRLPVPESFHSSTRRKVSLEESARLKKCLADVLR
jgi:hypothetical protein